MTRKKMLLALVVAALAIADVAAVIVAVSFRPRSWTHHNAPIVVAALQPSTHTVVAAYDGVVVDRDVTPFDPQLHAAIRARRDVDIGGWAVDKTEMGRFRAAIASVDGRPPFSVLYGAPREDVGRALKCAACAQSGFHVLLPARVLPPGEHRVRMQFVTEETTPAVVAGPTFVLTAR